jgi:large subunit ribosomal protein L30
MAEKAKKSANKTKTQVAAKAGTTMRVQYYRSMIATPEKHKRVVKGLGFTRLNQVVVREDTPSIRGMVNTVPHLVRVLE